MISSATDESTDVLAAVNIFLSLLGKHRTLVQHINPDSFYVKASPGHPLIHLSLAQYVSQSEKAFDNFRKMGIETVQVVPVDNMHKKAWIYENLAAVWIDTETRLDEHVDSTSVNLFTLHKFQGVWKISAIASEELSDDHVGYEIRSGIPEIINPIKTLFEHLTNQNWDGYQSILVPGFGASISRNKTTATKPSGLPLHPFIDKLKGVFAANPGATIEEKIFDFDARQTVGSQFGFAWTPFIAVKNGVTQSRGTNVFTIYLGDGTNGGGSEWRITGIQDTSSPV